MVPEHIGALVYPEWRDLTEHLGYSVENSGRTHLKSKDHILE